MSWVDLVVIASVGFAVWTGFRRGALLQVFSWGGFILGIAVGLALAPRIVGLFNVKSDARAIYTIIALLGIAFIFEGVVAALALRLRKKITSSTINRTDQILGAVIAATLSLAGIWLIAFPLARAPALASAIKRSAILRAISAIAPPPPALFAQIGRFLQSTGFPQVFSELNPSFAPGVAPPPASLKDNKNILAAAEITYKIESPVKGSDKSCNGEITGTGFPVGDNLFITAAHVVAGTQNTHIIKATGSDTYGATVVYIDTNKDIAVLRANVPGKALTINRTPAKTGTDGAAIGYPGGGPRKISPARVRVRTNARGYNIYSNKDVTREIYVLRAEVHPGNSGGPLVDTAGQVRGMIFAAAQSDPSESYALTETVILNAMGQAREKTRQVDTGGCAL